MPWAAIGTTFGLYGAIVGEYVYMASDYVLFPLGWIMTQAGMIF